MYQKVTTTHKICSSYANVEPKGKTLNFLYANVRSLVCPGRLDELRCIIESFQTTLHVIVLTETWIKDNFEAQRSSLPNYTHHFNYRTDIRGGGVSIFVHKDLKHEFLDERYENGNHFIWVRLDRLSLEIGAIYKQPTSDTNSFLETYESQLEKRKILLIFGDFNIDLLKNDNATEEYQDMLRENGFQIKFMRIIAHVKQQLLKQYWIMSVQIYEITPSI